MELKKKKDFIGPKYICALVMLLCRCFSNGPNSSSRLTKSNQIKIIYKA